MRRPFGARGIQRNDQNHHVAGGKQVGHQGPRGGKAHSRAGASLPHPGHHGRQQLFQLLHPFADKGGNPHLPTQSGSGGVAANRSIATGQDGGEAHDFGDEGGGICTGRSIRAGDGFAADTMPIAIGLGALGQPGACG